MIMLAYSEKRNFLFLIVSCMKICYELVKSMEQMLLGVRLIIKSSRDEGFYMNCTLCKKLINTYLDGYLPQDREQDMFNHIEACPECANYFDELMEIFGHLEEPDMDVPQGFRYAWRNEISHAAGKKRRANYKVLIPALAACACGVVIMSVMIFGAGGYNSGGGNVLGQAFSLDYSAQPGQSQQAADIQPGTVEDGNQQAQVQSEEGVIVQQPKTSGSNAAGKLLEESSQQQGGQAQHQAPSGADQQTQNVPEAKESAPVFGGNFAQGAEPGAAAQGGVVMPQIERKEVDGEMRYVLDARALNLSKSMIIEYAKSQNINVTETDNGIIVEEEPAVLKAMLEAYNLDTEEGMSKLEIILE